MAKKTCTVLCPHNKEHKLPVIIQLEDETKGAESITEEYCPFCDKPVRVKIDQGLKPDAEILRRFDFD